MKKTTKIIAILSSLAILGGIAYASVTVANDRYSSISKLPWNGSGWNTYDTAHDVGSVAAGDNARFTGTKGTDNVITDTRTGLNWESVPSTTTMLWENAKIHCAGLTKGGFSDWRLPNIRELLSIVDYSKTDGNNHWYNSKFTLEMFDSYWSSTTNASNTSTVRSLHLLEATGINSTKTSNLRVICTR